MLVLGIDAGKLDSGLESSGRSMSQRSHFWLRVIGLVVILAAEFGPRLWSSMQTAPVDVVAETR